MLPWSWVADSGYVRPSLVSLTPLSKPGALERSDRERVEPDARADPARVRTAVAKRQGHHAVRHAGEDPDGKLERAARVVDTDHVFVRETECLGGLRAHERGVVPRELGEGIGKLLQPPVVREPAVVKRRRGTNTISRPPADPLGARRRRSTGRRAPQRLRRDIGNDFGKLAAGKQPVMQDAVPLLVELGLAQDRFPGVAHDVVAGTILAADHQPQHFDRRFVRRTAEGSAAGRR